jgi:protein O-GlcNAc transferase
MSTMRARIREALRLKPDLLPAICNLGAVLFEQGKTAEAHALFEQALRSSPDQANTNYELGRLLKSQGKTAEAIACFRQAMQARAEYPEARFQLGIIHQEQGQFAEAEACYRLVVAQKPDHVEALNNLGAIYLEEGRLNEAQACFEQVIKLRPDHAGAHNNLGVLFLQEERLAEAAPYFQKALQLKADYTAARNNLAQVLQGLGKLDEARACYQESLAFTSARESLTAPDRSNAPDQTASPDGPAIVTRRHGASFHDAVQIKTAFALPVIMDSHEQILWHRQRLASEVNRLLNEDLLVDDPVRQVGITPFYLAYHGMNDRELMAKIATLFLKAAPSLNYVAPHCKSSLARTLPKGKRVRIGFISRYFYGHTIGKLFGSIPRLLSRKEFELFLFRFPGHDDPFARTIQEGADTAVTLPPRLDLARRMIAEQQLDILFYTDIGMEPLTYFLAFARLAPVQCVTWGHPVTTGIPTIDYFISSVDLETEESEDHYTEKLVRLPRLGVHYERPRAPEPLKDRAAFGLPADAHLYACPQSLFKFHPDFDEILAGILQQDPKGILVLIEGQQPYWTKLLRSRFNRVIPQVEERIRFLPRLSKGDFLCLLANADLLLDPVHFGGGNSSYEGLGLGIPVVTLPSSFLRGRLTYAMYKQMGLGDLIAADSSHYIHLANQIACEPQFREYQCRQIREVAGSCLFEDVSALHDLNNCLAKLTKTEEETP